MTHEPNDSGLDDEAFRLLRARLDWRMGERALVDVQRRVRVAIADERGAPAWHRPWVIALTVMSLAIAAVVVSFLGMRHAHPPDSAPVAMLTPPIILSSANATRRVVGAGNEFTAAEHEQLEVTIGPDTQVSITGPASFGASAAGLFVLHSGSASVVVAKQQPGHRVELGLGDALIVVHGTRFTIEATHGRAARVHVTEGTVELRRGEVSLALLQRGDVWSDPPQVHDSVQSSDHAAVVKPRGEPAADTRSDGRKPVDLQEQAAKALARRDCPATHALVERIVAATNDANEAANATMLDAECLIRTSHHERALPLLDKIATDYASQPSAQSALFEAGTIRADLGMSAEAITTLTAYAERYPKGTFADAAAFRRCELIARAQSHQDGAACLSAYVARFPTGHRLGDALLMSGSLACSDDRVSDAEHAYFDYLGHVSAEHDDVANLRVLLRCLERVKAPSLADAKKAFAARHGELK